MSGLVYYSSASGNTRRMVERLGLPATALPQDAETDPPLVHEPFVLMCPTYADRLGKGAVPKSVIRFLNIASNRANIRGVIANGNKNFGETYALAGTIIAEKCNVPLLYRFELAGTDTDTARIRSGLAQFWAEQEEKTCLMQA